MFTSMHETSEIDHLFTHLKDTTRQVLILSDMYTKNDFFGACMAKYFFIGTVFR